MPDSTHHPALESWVESANAPGADFPIQNLPYATFRLPNEERPRLGIAIGNMLLDASEALGIPSMNHVLAMSQRGAHRRPSPSERVSYEIHPRSRSPPASHR